MSGVRCCVAPGTCNKTLKKNIHNMVQYHCCCRAMDIESSRLNQARKRFSGTWIDSIGSYNKNINKKNPYLSFILSNTLLFMCLSNNSHVCFIHLIPPSGNRNTINIRLPDARKMQEKVQYTFRTLFNCVNFRSSRLNSIVQ